MSRGLRAKAVACRIAVTEHSAGAVVPHFSHFVSAGSLALSLHALLAIADARPIVTKHWLEASVAAGVPLDVSGFLVSDRKAEKAHKFSYRSSLAAARKQRLLAGVQPALRCSCCSACHLKIVLVFCGHLLSLHRSACHLKIVLVFCAHILSLYRSVCHLRYAPRCPMHQEAGMAPATRHLTTKGFDQKLACRSGSQSLEEFAHAGGTCFLTPALP